MVMAGDSKKPGFKARLMSYWTRLGAYQKKLEPARGVSRVRLGVYLGGVHPYSFSIVLLYYIRFSYHSGPNDKLRLSYKLTLWLAALPTSWAYQWEPLDSTAPR